MWGMSLLSRPTSRALMPLGLLELFPVSLHGHRVAGPLGQEMQHRGLGQCLLCGMRRLELAANMGVSSKITHTQRQSL